MSFKDQQAVERAWRERVADETLEVCWETHEDGRVDVDGVADEVTRRLFSPDARPIEVAQLARQVESVVAFNW